MAFKVSIRDSDSGFKKIVSNAKSLESKHVAVGVQGSDALQLAKSTGKNGEIVISPDVTLVDVATVNEFGTSRSPQRSFLRSAIDQNRPALSNIVVGLTDRIVMATITLDKGLGLLGERIQSDVQKQITAGGTPFVPNAPATVAQKGSASPLIDTGQLRQSIRWVIKDGPA